MENPCRIAFYGDSITREYAREFPGMLVRRYPDHEVDFIKAGVIGETSRLGLKRLPGLLDEKPDVVVIGFGMNDWRKGVGPVEFRKNISKMADAFIEIGTRVILLTVSPASLGALKGSSPEVDEYSEIVREVALARRIKVGDVNLEWKRRFRKVKVGLRDLIHPNHKGYEVIHEVLMNVVPQSHTTILWQYNGRECLCNYNCPYCYYSYSPKNENYFWGDIGDWRDRFRHAFGDGKLVFYLAFGEPTIGKGFMDVVRMIEEEPNWSLRITTNLSGNLDRLIDTRLAKEGRLNINASFHPTQTTTAEFLEQLLKLRSAGIESPVIYVMWPNQMDRFERDFRKFDAEDFVVHVRRFKGIHDGKVYPDAYTDEERRFVAKYCDDATIRYMLNERPVMDRRTYSGYHFFIVDSTGNVGMDSDCFRFGTQYRGIYGNIVQSDSVCQPTAPPVYPMCCTQGTVDGVTNYIEIGYHQLEGNNVLHFAEQGGVYKDENGVHYRHMETDFTDARIRADYYFPPRGIGDRWRRLRYEGIRNRIRAVKYRLYYPYMHVVERLGSWVRI